LGAGSAWGQTNPIVLNPAVLQFTFQIGSTKLPVAQTMQVQSTPAGANFTVAVSGSPFNAAWLLVSASSGKAPTPLKISVNPTGLSAGTYSGTITISSTINSQAVTQSATVTLAISTPSPTVTATPASLSFSYTTGGPIPAPSLASAFLLSSSGSPLTATVSVKGATWLTATPSGSVSIVGLLNTISVKVDPTGLAPKIYTGQISINAPGATNQTLTLAVTLTVNAATPVITGTWPPGVIRGSAATTATVEGSSFFPNSTAKATGFTPAATISVTDGTNTASDTFYIPVYAASASVLRLAVASPLPNGTVGTAYAAALAGAGGTGPYSYSLAAGTLPPGLSISSGAILGTPTAAGSYLATVQVTDSSPSPLVSYGQLKVTIDPTGSTALRTRVAAAPLPLGTMGTAYGPVTLTAAGGTGPYTWSALNLPAGLTLSSGGVLSGTPVTDGSLGTLTVAVVSDTALLVAIPPADMATEGILRIGVTTPAPGGGLSNEGQFQVYGPEPQIMAVTNAASLTQGTIAPGEVVAIFGLGLGPDDLTVFHPSSPPIPTSLPSSGSATSVTINGTPAPILYTSSSQVGVLVPQSITGTVAQVVVSYGGLVSQVSTATLVPVDPGIFSVASSGHGQGAILNYNSTTADYTINSAANPAVKGSTVVIYVTGTGVSNSLVDNQLIPASPAVVPLVAPTVTIGGQSAVVLGAQAPPGSVPGLIQINAVVPATLQAAPAAPVVVTVGSASSQAGLTMAVK
jgi:uncharacterized protein (TIGR03437 family)